MGEQADPASAPTRVLHVLESLSAGGIETTFLNVLKAWKAVGATGFVHDVLAFAGGELESRYRRACDRLVIGGGLEALETVLPRGRGIVHLLFERCAHRLGPGLLARGDLAVIYGKGYDLSAAYRLDGGLDWPADVSLLEACDAVTFTTGELAALHGVSGDRVAVLGKGVDARAFAGVADVTPATPSRVLCVANVHPLKRIGNLIDALSLVRRSVPSAEVRVVGGGSSAEVERLRARATAAGLAEAFTLAGRVTDVAAEIELCRVVTLTSAYEGVPTALLEAMAAGRPVIATRVGHVHTIVTDGVEGYLVAADDVDALAARLTRILLDPTLAGHMGMAGRRRAAAYDVSGVARRLLDLFRRVECGLPKPGLDRVADHRVTDAGGRAGRRSESDDRTTPVMTPEASTFLNLWGEVGSDRYPAREALATPPGSEPMGARAWEVYRQHFGRFTGARTDPTFERLRNRVSRAGRLVYDPDTAVVVVGVGPSLQMNVDRLVRLRDRCCLMTSPRGAAVLARAGLFADVTLVSEPSHLRAELARRDLEYRDEQEVLRSSRWVTVDPRTPDALLTGLDDRRVFVSEPFPTWGLWPASAVALARLGGATRIGLLGVDLGTPDRPDASFGPLSAVLSLVALAPGGDYHDCGTQSAKDGWRPSSLEELMSDGPARPPTLEWTARMSAPRRQEEARRRLAGLTELRHWGSAALSCGLEARAHGVTADRERRLRSILEEIIAWGRSTAWRDRLQDDLGLALLPRLWRHPDVAAASAAGLWRPVVMALHELTTQADRMQAMLDSDARWSET